MNPFQNTGTNQNGDGFDGGGSLYGNLSQNGVVTQDPMQSSVGGVGVDMNGSYQTSIQNNGLEPINDYQGFASIEKPKPPMLLIGIVIFIIMILTAGGVAYIFLGKNSSDSSNGKTDAITQQPKKVSEKAQSQGLTVDDSTITKTESLNLGKESTDEVSLNNSPEVTLIMKLDEETPITKVGQSGKILISVLSESSKISAFDFLIQFDPKAFDITEEDIEALDDSFDKFIFYKEHETGMAHLTISGVHKPDSSFDEKEEINLLSLSFNPTASGSFEFSLLDKFDSESTKLIDSENNNISFSIPETLSVEITE